MKAVILAGGKATRLRPLSDDTPKSLIEVAGKPFVFHQLDLLREASIKRVVLCVGWLAGMIHDCVGTHYRGIDIEYSFDGKSALGTAGALKKALPMLGNIFWVIYGDSYLPDCEYAEAANTLKSSRKPALLTIIRNEDKRYRNNVLMQKGKLTLYDKERPGLYFQHIDYGMSVMSPGSLLAYDCADLSEVYRNWSFRERLASYEMHGRFYEIGTPEGLAETRKYLEEKRW
jgi:NDP-sugar pyrophosphorylase family protein